ncbi:MAG TPA: ABC transporter permease [Thermoplasmata archaeon]|jgi:peptide/nickel transport system permease protein
MARVRDVRTWSWLPRHSILGRVVYPLLEERRTLAGAMCWLGIAIVILFLVVAVLAPVFAPFDPLLFQDEKNIPPWTNAPVARNETYTLWSGNWTRPAEAQFLNGVGAVSANPGDAEIYSGFTLFIHRDAVTAAGLDLWLVPSGTDPGQYAAIAVSADAGFTWTPVGDVRAAGQLVRIDLTGLHPWTAQQLDTSHLQVRVVHGADPGTSGNLTVDYVGATAVWLSSWHLMGTDLLGRDVFTRILYGTRTSLLIMAIGVFVALAVGFPLGLYSGYIGGNIDKTLVLVMDSIYSFPGLLFAGLIAVLLGKGVVNIGLAVTVIYIPLYFRVTRSQVLSAREELYVEAARAIGASPRRIMFRYIAVNVLVAIPVIFSISAADAILTAAGLSYLGLGVEAPTPDWGLDLAAGANLIDNGIWWSSFFPGLVIVLLTVGLSFLGEGLNDIINPLLKKERS